MESEDGLCPSSGSVFQEIFSCVRIIPSAVVLPKSLLPIPHHGKKNWDGFSYQNLSELRDKTTAQQIFIISTISHTHHLPPPANPRHGRHSQPFSTWILHSQKERVSSQISGDGWSLPTGSSWAWRAPKDVFPLVQLEQGNIDVVGTERFGHTSLPLLSELWAGFWEVLLPVHVLGVKLRVEPEFQQKGGISQAHNNYGFNFLLFFLTLPSFNRVHISKNSSLWFLGVFSQKSHLVSKVGKVGMSRPILALAGLSSSALPWAGEEPAASSLFLELITALD